MQMTASTRARLLGASTIRLSYFPLAEHMHSIPLPAEDTVRYAKQGQWMGFAICIAALVGLFTMIVTLGEPWGIIPAIVLALVPGFLPLVAEKVAMNATYTEGR